MNKCHTVKTQTFHHFSSAKLSRINDCQSLQVCLFQRFIAALAIFITVFITISVPFVSFAASELPGIIYASSDTNDVPAADSKEASSSDSVSSSESNLNPEVDNAVISSDSPAYCKALNERYYVSRLTSVQYSNFLALYNTVSNFESVCVFPENISESEVEAFVRILHLDCPELFQVEGNASYTVSVKGGKIISVSIPYAIDRENYEKMLSECKAAVSAIKSSIPDGLSERAREMLVYDALASTCTYNEQSPFSGSAYGALILHNAKCDGISLAVKWVLDELGIETMVVSGRAEGASSGHAWNVVKIDGVFYDLDIVSDMVKNGVYSPLYCSFNVSDSWIRSRYIPVSSLTNYFSIPGCPDMSGSFHVKNDSYFHAGTNISDIRQYFFSAADRIRRSSSSAIFMQFESSSDFEAFKNGFGDMLYEWSSSRSKSIETSSSYSSDYRTIRIQTSIR